MKKQFLILACATICLLTACSTANFAYYDDIYSSSGEKSAQTVTPASPKMAQNNTTVEADSIIYETDENGNLLRTLTYYPGSSEPVVTTYMEVADEQAATTASYGSSGSYSYDPDDYYDYSYSSRIRRFHNNYYTGWSYYDPYFTNMYWYDYCPSNWGLSIYMGYNWWWPSYYYRPYYYSPYWYDYGFHYGWGWHYPYHHLAYIDPWYHYHHHGCDPIDYYHNHHDQNHSYYYGHRNNIGPSVGNGSGRGELPEDNHHGGIAGGGYGNGETNNHYSVTSTPTSFNQRYDRLASGTTGAGSSFNNGGSNTITPSTPTNPTNPIVTGARTEAPGAKKPTDITAQPVNSGVSTPSTNNSGVTRPASVSNVTTSRTEAPTNVVKPTTVTRPSSGTVTRTVVTPSSVTTRPATITRPATTTRPSSTTRPSTTVPAYSNSRYDNTPSGTSSSRPAYERPSSTNSSSPSGSRSNYSSPSSNSRPSYSAPSNNSRPSYSAPSSSSRSSYSASSSSRSSFNSSSSSSRSYSSPSSSSHSSSSSSSHSGRR